MALNRPLVAMDLSTSGPTDLSETPSKRQQWHTSPPPLRAPRPLIFLPPLLIAFCISTVLFVLEQLTISIFNSHEYFKIEYGIQLNIKSTTIMIWTSVVTAILSALAGLAFWELRGGHERRARFWAFTNIVVTLGNVALVVACTVVAFKAQEDDKNANIVEFFPELILWVGTRETIMCTFKGIAGRHLLTSMGCGFAVRSIFLSVPWVIFNIETDDWPLDVSASDHL
jgi:hypothetical protein